MLRTEYIKFFLELAMELVSKSCRISVTGTHTDFRHVSESLIAVGHV